MIVIKNVIDAKEDAISKMGHKLIAHFKTQDKPTLDEAIEIDDTQWNVIAWPYKEMSYAYFVDYPNYRRYLVNLTAKVAYRGHIPH